MLYAWDILVTANTLESAPKEQLLKITSGVIVLVTVSYRAGCQGWVRVRILHEESVLVPLNKDTWLTGDDETVPAPMWFKISATGNILKFRAHSAGTTYPHTITVRVSILPPEVALILEALGWIKGIAQRMGLIA